MPPVRKDTVPAEGARRMTTRMALEAMPTVRTAAKGIPKQQPDAQIEHECPHRLSQW